MKVTKNINLVDLSAQNSEKASAIQTCEALSESTANEAEAQTQQQNVAVVGSGTAVNLNKEMIKFSKQLCPLTQEIFCYLRKLTFDCDGIT